MGPRLGRLVALLFDSEAEGLDKDDDVFGSGHGILMMGIVAKSNVCTGELRGFWTPSCKTLSSCYSIISYQICKC